MRGWAGLTLIGPQSSSTRLRFALYRVQHRAHIDIIFCSVLCRFLTFELLLCSGRVLTLNIRDFPKNVIWAGQLELKNKLDCEGFRLGANEWLFVNTAMNFRLPRKEEKILDQLRYDGYAHAQEGAQLS